MGLTDRLEALYEGLTASAPLTLAATTNGGHYAAWQGSLMQVLEELRSGKLAPADLNESLFLDYRDKLAKGASKGFGADLMKIDYDTPDYALLSKMKANIFTFSGVKAYTELRELNDLLYDEKGRLVSKELFKINAADYYRRAGVVDKKYYDWLDIEHDTFIAQATKARQWQEWMDNRDVYPNLKYVTVGDDHVRHKHQLLDGVVVEKGSAYCDKIIPIKDWGCRCDMHETTEPVTADPPEFEHMGPFEGNVGKTGIAISSKHPYYEEAKKDLKRIQDRVDSFGLQEHIRNNRKIYEQYKGDPNYQLTSFDDSSGGFVVTHRKADALTAAERKVLDNLMQRGERIVLPEKTEAAFGKSFDLSLNECPFDIKAITGNVKKETEKRVKEAMDQASNALLYFNRKIDVEYLRRGLGNVKNESRLNTVMVMVQDTIAIITKKEILAKDFSALEVLK